MKFKKDIETQKLVDEMRKVEDRKQKAKERREAGRNPKFECRKKQRSLLMIELSKPEPKEKKKKNTCTSPRDLKKNLLGSYLSFQKKPDEQELVDELTVSCDYWSDNEVVNEEDEEDYTFSMADSEMLRTVGMDSPRNVFMIPFPLQSQPEKCQFEIPIGQQEYYYKGELLFNL